MANNLYQDVYEAFMEGRWHPKTDAQEIPEGWKVSAHDNHGRAVSHTDQSLAEAHNRTMDKIREAIQEGRFLP